MSLTGKKTTLRNIRYTFPAGQRSETFPYEVNFVSVFSVKIESEPGVFTDAPGDTALFQVDLAENSHLEQVQGIKCNIPLNQVTGKLTLTRTGEDFSKPLQLNLVIGWDPRPDEIKPPVEDHRAIFDIAALTLALSNLIPKSLPTWTRLIPPIVDGVEKPTAHPALEHAIKAGAVTQVALQDSAAIVRRIHCVLTRSISANVGAILYVRVGSEKGAYIRRVILDSDFVGDSPLTVGKFNTASRTGYVEIKGGDALFVYCTNTTANVSLHVEEEYLAESPRPYLNTGTIVDRDPPPTPPTHVNPMQPSDLQPIINAINQLANPPTTVAETTIVGDPKLCPWPSVPVYVDGNGKWWEIQGAFIGDGYYDVMDDSYNKKNVFVPAASVQCQEMTRMQTTVVEGGTTVVG